MKKRCCLARSVNLQEVEPQPSCFRALTRTALGAAPGAGPAWFLCCTFCTGAILACDSRGRAPCPQRTAGGVRLPSPFHRSLLFSCVCAPAPPQMVLPPRLRTFQTLRSCGPMKLSASGGRRDTPGPTPLPASQTCATASFRKTRRQFSAAWSTMTPATPLCCDAATPASPGRGCWPRGKGGHGRRVCGASSSPAGGGVAWPLASRAAQTLVLLVPPLA